MWGWWRPPCLLRNVIVNLKDDPSTSLEGVLCQARGPWLTLKSGALLRAGADRVPADGELLIHRDNVAFLQVLP